MSNKQFGIILAAIGLVAILCGAALLRGGSGSAQQGGVGAAGSMLIEQYIPYVLYNGGINTALPATFSDTVTGAGSTWTTGSFSSTLGVTGATTLSSTLAVAATTTASKAVVVSTSNTATSTLSAGCIQMTATSTGNPIRLVFEATTTYSNGSALSAIGATPSGIVLFATGVCPGLGSSTI